MRQFFRTLTAGLLCLAATGEPSYAAKTSDTGRVRFTSVTNLPDFDCASPNSSYPGQKCEDMVFEVQIVKIKQPNGAEVACVAFLPYSKLTVHTATKGEKVILKWHVSSPGSFVGKGIDIKEDFGDKVGDLIDSQAATPQDANLKFKSNVKQKKKFNHLPRTQQDFGGGVRKDCDGGDPIISNSAD